MIVMGFARLAVGSCRGQRALHPSYVSRRSGAIVMGSARLAVCFLAVANARCAHPTFCGDLVRL
ncbi:hypothetical protein CVS48_00085 [Achromobacter spanius]|nr:hypothetical protein CVS48_00085 [Achromobacter spanius]